MQKSFLNTDRRHSAAYRLLITFIDSGRDFFGSWSVKLPLIFVTVGLYRLNAKADFDLMPKKMTTLRRYEF